VYDATHLPTGGARRVYVLRPGAMQNNPLVHRVVCEADAARWLRNPAAAKLEAHGDTPSRRLYVAVERPDGRPLGDVLAEAGRLAPWRVVRLAGRLVEALDEAHAVGLAHGRLTPAAAVVAPDADGAELGSAPAVTLTGLGTAALDGADPVAAADRPYVSPEQLDGRDADVRSDVFGLASLLQHALTGAPPVEPAADAPEPSADESAVHGVLAAARAVDPARRQATIKAFWEDLLEALVADAVRATRPADAAPPAPRRAGRRARGARPPRAGRLRGRPGSAGRRRAAGARAGAARARVPRRRDVGARAAAAGRPAPGAPAGVGRAADGRRGASAPPRPGAGAAGPRAGRAVGARACLVARRTRVAAAVGWPMTRGARRVAPPPAVAASAAWRDVSSPPVLETVTATSPALPRRQAAAGTLVVRTADASGVADERATPSAPNVELPQVSIGEAGDGAGRLGRRARARATRGVHDAHQDPGAPQ
jgi:serine/threonine-protein kinase